MTTYSRLSRILGEERHYPLGEDCSFERGIVGLNIIDKIFSVFQYCPKCKKGFFQQVVGIETNNYTGTSRITQWYGLCCRKCGIVQDNNGDIN